MIFRQLVDHETKTYSYLLGDERRREAVIIDPVLGQSDRDLSIIDELGLKLITVLETGLHGDHLSGAGELKAKTGCDVAVPELSNIADADRILKHGDAVRFGLHALEARTTPGRTNTNMIFVSADLDRAFVGATLLIRNIARLDHPGSDPALLYKSIRDEIFSLPCHTKLYPGRDTSGRTVTTVQEEIRHNPFVGKNNDESSFIGLIKARALPPRDSVEANLNANMGCLETATGALAINWAPISRTVTGVPEVTVEWVNTTAGQFRIIDVRGDNEFNDLLGHIDSAELVPLGTLDTAAVAWNKDERLIVVCRSGGRSGRAAALLENSGFRNVASMAGGMLEWKRESYESIRE
jgi:glyoxylase-like metal-dependent hydrolase (beta-lactamase superfamily II)/rhodanese-related sulfurtransferase